MKFRKSKDRLTELKEALKVYEHILSRETFKQDIVVQLLKYEIQKEIRRNEQRREQSSKGRIGFFGRRK